MVPGLSLKNYINGFTSTELTNVIFTCPRRNFLWSFDNQKNLDYIVKGGTCSWGRPSLFVTPWFPTFDATTMVVMKMSVRIRLHNLPFPFWHHQVLEGIGNSLGRFLKMDRERMDKCIFTFAHMCMEIDLSKGLLDHIHLSHQDFKWTQWLDFENATFS